MISWWERKISGSFWIRSISELEEPWRALSSTVGETEAQRSRSHVLAICRKWPHVQITTSTVRNPKKHLGAPETRFIGTENIHSVAEWLLLTCCSAWSQVIIWMKSWKRKASNKPSFPLPFGSSGMPAFRGTSFHVSWFPHGRCSACFRWGRAKEGVAARRGSMLSAQHWAGKMGFGGTSLVLFDSFLAASLPPFLSFQF